MSGHWEHGQLVVRGEELGLQPSAVAERTPTTGVWMAVPVFVVEDSAEQLVTYFAPGAEFRFPDGDWPTADHRHPWSGRDAWAGHGCLMVQRPGEHFAVWHFWDGPDRQFSCWYMNLQTAFVRTSAGYHTQDLELDIVVLPGEEVIVKDAEVLDERVAAGRYSAELVEWIRSYGDELLARLDAEGIWWDRSWAQWQPPADWVNPRIEQVDLS